MFSRNVFILESAGFVKRALQDVVQSFPEMLLRETLYFRQPRDFACDFLLEHFGADPEPRKQWRHYSVGLRHERSQ